MISRRRLLWGAVAAIALLGSAARLSGLDIQNYWIDELFSVQQSHRDVRHVLSVGRTEVHPPTYALLIWAWIRVGFKLGLTGDSVAWTHLLSALLSVAGIVVSYLALRRSRLPDLARALIVATTACSGFSLAYAQETRSYSLTWLAAVGTTALTLRLADPGTPESDDGRTRRRAWWAWVAWGALGSASHMFGAVLAVGAAATLALRRRQQWRRALLLGGVATLPQVIWLVVGLLFTPKFADGAKWAGAPTPASVLQLLRNTFAWGPLTQVEDGFYFHGSAALLATLALLVVAATLRYVVPLAHRPTPDAAGPDHTDDPAPAADPVRAALATLAILSGGTIAATYALSQVQHLWLLRNMIVIAPALSWLASLAIAWLAPPGRARLVLVGALAATLIASLGSATAAQRTPYKTGFRDAMRDVIAFRAAYPDGFVQHNVDNWWLIGTDLPRDDESLRKLLLPGQRISPSPFPTNVIRTDQPTLVVGMRLHLTDNEEKGRYVIDSLGPDRCRQILHKDVTVVWCDRPTAADPAPTSRPAPAWPRR